MMHITVESVRYAIGRFCSPMLTSITWFELQDTHFDTSLQDTHNLYLILGHELRERDEYANLEGHLTAILHSVSMNIESINTNI